MVHLFLGDDLPAKDAKISEIKQKCFQGSPEALAFDFDDLDAKELKEDQLKQAFLALPVVAPQRLIVVRQIHKLKSADTDVLMTFCRKPAKHCDVILESSESTFKGNLKDLPQYARTLTAARPEGPNVFDMTKLISARRGGEALKMLNVFYSRQVHPLQIMGALVWFWSKEGKAAGPERFERGLRALEEADLNIKRSRLDPQYAVEKVVVELGRLMAG